MKQFNSFIRHVTPMTLYLKMDLGVTYLTYQKETAGLSNIFGTDCDKSAETVYFSVKVCAGWVLIVTSVIQ
jgi:hypothetical protein